VNHTHALNSMAVISMAVMGTDPSRENFSEYI